MTEPDPFSDFPMIPRPSQQPQQQQVKITHPAPHIPHVVGPPPLPPQPLHNTFVGLEQQKRRPSFIDISTIQTQTKKQKRDGFEGTSEMFAHLNERIGEGTAAVRRSNLTIIYANPAFRSMLGLANDIDLSERVIVSLFDLASGDFIRNIASGHEEIDTSLELHASVRKEGELGLASIFVSTYIKSFGDTLLFTLRDLSSSGERGLVANPAAAAHLGMQMRTVVMGANTLADYLINSAPMGPQKEYANLIKASLRQLARITTDFEFYSKLEHNMIQLDSTEFDLHKAVEDVVYGMSEGGLACDVSCVIGMDVPRVVRGDSHRLTRIIHNLLNSTSSVIVSFMGSFNFQILLTVELAKKVNEYRHIRFSISSDTGKEACLLEHSNSFEMGLELPIAKRLIQLMNGTMGLEGNHGSSDSRFWFSVQVEDVRNSEVHRYNKQSDEDLSSILNIDSAIQSAFKRQNITVVLVEKNAEMVRFIQSFLSALCCNCVVAPSYREAWKYIQGDISPILLVSSNDGSTMSNYVGIDDNVDELNVGLVPSSTRNSIMFGRSISPELEQFIYYLRNSSNKWYIPVCVLTNIPSNPQVTKKLIRKGFTEYVPAPLSFETLYSTMGSLCGIEPAPKFRNGSTAKSTNTRYGKVLVVDDNVVNQKILTRLLKSVGLRYDIACNGKEAVSFYKKTPGYSVILMDTMMPVMDGFQATIKIRAHEATTNRHIPIIAVTGLELLDTKNAKEKCISAGMDDYIPKPVIMKTLKETIFKWLEKEPSVKNPVRSLFDLCFEVVLQDYSSKTAPKVLPEVPPKLSQRIADVISSKPITEDVLQVFSRCNFKKLTLVPAIPHKADLLASMLPGSHPGLTDLNIAGNTYLSDNGLAYISRLTNLTTLNLSRCPRITKHGIQTFTTLTNLKVLSVEGCPYITKNCIQFLRTLKQIQTINCAEKQKLFNT